MEKLHEKLKFRAIKNRFWGRSKCIEKEIELGKITRKKINEINRLETETQEMQKLKIEGESKTTNLLSDLSFGKGLITDEIILI